VKVLAEVKYVEFADGSKVGRGVSWLANWFDQMHTQRDATMAQYKTVLDERGLNGIRELVKAKGQEDFAKMPPGERIVLGTVREMLEKDNSDEKVSALLGQASPVRD
jgi:hypothetical protein